MPNTFDEGALMAAARAAREHSYSPYSAFAVGAALLCEDGSIVTSCNVENASYRLTNCAEAVAVASAVSQGKRRFSAIAIAGPPESVTPPCGACRQVLAEFAPSLTVLYSNGKESHATVSLETLLPAQFELP
jgi:cytidine deaminase